MNYFNHKNVQLAYEAVYNQDLCESMEDLGLIDGYDYLDESLSRAFTVGTLSTGGQVGSDIAGIAKGAGRIFRGAGRKVKAAMQRIRPEPQKEEYELYNTILEYLIQEGYADTLGSAEIILGNMSEGWIQSIIEDTEYLDEGLTGARRKRALEMGLTHLATAEEGSSVTKNADKNMPSRRGGGSGLRRNPNRWGRPGTITPGPGVLERDDRGSANRARRRAGKKVADNVDRHYYNDESPDF